MTVKLILVGVLIIILLLQTFVYGSKMKQLVAPSTTKGAINQMEMMKLKKTFIDISKYINVIYAVVVWVVVFILIKPSLNAFNDVYHFILNFFTLFIPAFFGEGLFGRNIYADTK